MEGFSLKKRSPGRRSPKARGSSPANDSGRKYEFVGLILLTFAVLSGVGLLGWNVGFVGIFFANIFRYLFGWGAAFAILVIGLVSIQYILHLRGLLYTKRFFGVVGLFISILAAWHHFVIPVGEEILPQSLADGGGLLGGSVLLVLRKFFGVDGSIILLTTIILGSVLLSTTWSFASGYIRTKEQAKKGASAAGTAVSATYEKMSAVSEKIEEKAANIVSDVRASVPYNQANDTLFAEADMPDEIFGANLPEKPVPEAIETLDVPALEEREQKAEIQAQAPYEPLIPVTAEEEEADHTVPSIFPIRYAEDNAQSEEAIDVALPYGHQEDTTSAPMIEISHIDEPAIEIEEDAAPFPLDAPSEPPAAPSSAKKPPQISNSVEMPPDHKENAYELPKVTHILSKHIKQENESLAQEIEENAHILHQTLENFHVNAKVISACHGPAVTRYDLEPAPGVKVSKITNLAEDIALQLATSSVRIEPVPGKAAIGIEIPNRTLESVQLREVLENPQFQEAQSKLTVGLGKDIGGQAVFADIGKMPHLLVAGATGSGKSVCINTLISSILFKAAPDEVKFILIDPKMVELSNYNGIPHLMVPVVTDPKKASSVLNWAVQEMEKRYTIFANHGVRDIKTFNRRYAEEKMPLIVIVIDELADLMMIAPRDVEDAICRILQKARAAGIHMILATQRPSVNVITGIIKANLPSRISFAVSSQVDSRTILDRGGAETLLGKGDMLFSPQGVSKPLRVQGAFISDEEVEMLLDFIRAQGQEIDENEELVSFIENETKENESEEDDEFLMKQDKLLPEAVELVLSTGQASSSSIQRRFRVGYSRAARLVDAMEELRIIGPSAGGNKPREILMTPEQARELVKSVM